MRLLNYLSNILQVFLTELRVVIKYGLNVPRPFQCIYIKPSEIAFSTKYFREGSPKVLCSEEDIDDAGFLKVRHKFITGGNWDLETVDLTEVSIIKRAIKHYQYGMSWEAVGEVEWLMKRIQSNGTQDGCTDKQSIYRRLERLDDLYDSISEGNYILRRKDLSKFSFREKGGIGVAIGRDGQLIWLGDGAHRLVIAMALKLPKIPVALLLLHEEAFNSGRFDVILDKSKCLEVSEH